ncbi:MAG: multidrug ABC transporter ATP-binding protein [Rhizobiales bacterium 65-9]|nr:ABC transporter ATP-binding protein [Hyphomicrobiales bacterium]OJY35865.1 MAG: multidrug ABC transporter ATP-binding protein [Rhizobiales bacterium 65-9]
MLASFFRWLETRIDVFAPFDERSTPPTTVWRFIWHHLYEVRGWLAVILVSGLVFSGVEALTLMGVGWLVDLITNNPPDVVWRDYGGWLIGGVLFILIVRPLVFFFNHAVVDQVVVPQLTNRIRWRSHVYTLGHALSYFQNDFAGRLGARVIQSGQSVRSASVGIIDDLWHVMVFAAVAMGYFGHVSYLLMAPVAIWVALYVALLWYFVPRARARSEQNSFSRSASTARIVDSYTNIATVKLFARGDVERSSVHEALARWAATFLDLTRLITGVVTILQTLNSVLVVATLYIALRLWSEQAMTPGEVAAAVAIVLRLVQMSGWVMQLVRNVFEEIGSVQEAMNTIAKPHALLDAPDARPLVVTKGEIRFEHVSFHYGKGSGVIEDMSLVIRPGEKVGLIGPSGAGKSTMVNLLLRLHDVEGGRILVDGQDIAGVTQDSLRAAIGVVTQDTSLLHRSIHDNIAYGRPNAARAEIESAARLAKAEGFIAELVDLDGRKGYESRVGERGVKLSGGQRQRIAIARVILKDAPILVLDEATSALDSEIEAAIQEGLDTLMRDKTVIAIAHRLSTIASLDRLVVMDEGRIVEEGTHAELLARGGLYASLWARQSGGFLAFDRDEKTMTEAAQ